jgi:hypothetical protein
MAILDQPLRLSDEQMNALLAASYPLHAQRNSFLVACARELAQLPMIGDGAVSSRGDGSAAALFRSAAIRHRQRRLSAPRPRRVAALHQPQVRRRTRSRLLLQKPPEVEE